MKRRNWKRVYPHTMQEAIRLCLDWAAHRHNRGVARVAELMGISEWTVYKWMSEGSMPSSRIRPFEFACDATYVTEYIGHSARKLVVDIPSGSVAGGDDLLALNAKLQDAVQLLTQFYHGDLDDDAVIGGVTAAMTELAKHRVNVSKSEAPELELFGGGA